MFKLSYELKREQQSDRVYAPEDVATECLQLSPGSALLVAHRQLPSRLQPVAAQLHPLLQRQQQLLVSLQLL